MGANRKLQIEIDRTLKKVAEGIETFDEIWDKVYETDQVSLKEKYEADLKKEIKKLQRYRDTIKTWLGGSDIKDKSQLLEARKAVERQMERFKVCEKETKTKMFSKEGLALAQKQDPKEKARNEMRDWINTTVATLTEQAENFDAEVEELQPGKKKGKPPPRLVHAEESANRHRAHVKRLEQILRLLDNEAIEAEDLNEVQSSVNDYLDRNQEDFDFFSCPDDSYEDVLEQLDNLEAQQPVAVNHIGKDTKKESKEREKEREKERNAVMAMKLQLAGGGHAVTIEETSPEKPAARKAPDTRQNSTATPRAGAAGAALKGEASKEASSSDAAELLPANSESLPSTPRRQPPPQAPSARHDPSTTAPQQVTEEQRQSQGAPVSAAPGAQTPALPAGTPSFAAAAAAAAAAVASSNQARQTSGEGASAPSEQAKGEVDDASKKVQNQRQAAAPSNAQPLPPTIEPSYASPMPATPPNTQTQGALGYQIGRPAAPQAVEAGTSNLHEEDQSARSEKANSKPVLPLSNMAELPPESQPVGPTAAVPAMGYSNTHLHLLSASSRSLPTPTDRLWGTKAIQPRLVPNGVPQSYPDTKIPILENPQLFEKLETEALFYAFYYQPGTYQQYLAARELKRQSWRYHKQHRAWFQRHEEPKTATEEYEQGTYVYFDYNIMHDDLQSGWCYRLKQDFTFRYDALEDDLQV